METELAQAVDVTMARENYILMIKVNELFPFHSSRCLKGTENNEHVLRISIEF